MLMLTTAFPLQVTRGVTRPLFTPTMFKLTIQLSLWANMPETKVVELSATRLSTEQSRVATIPAKREETTLF